MEKLQIKICKGVEQVFGFSDEYPLRNSAKTMLNADEINYNDQINEGSLAYTIKGLS